MHFSAFQHTLLERWESRVLVISLFWFPPSQVPYKVSASQDTEREKWKKCIVYLSFFTAPPPLPSGQKYCSTNLTDQPSTTPPLSVWISGLNTEFRKGTITAAMSFSYPLFQFSFLFCSGCCSCLCFADSGFSYRRLRSIPTLGLLLRSWIFFLKFRYLDDNW